MENQQFYFYKQKNRWGMTIVCIVLALLLVPFLSVTAFVPRMLTILPIALMIMMAYVGVVSAAACGIVIIAYAGVLFGIWGSVCAALFLVPVIVATAITSEKNVSFWKASAICGIIMIACEYLILLIVTAITGTDAISAVVQIFADFFNENTRLTDTLFDAMIETGLIEGSGITSISSLSSSGRIAVLQSLLISLDELLRLEMPMQVATGAVSAGLLGQFIVRKGMRKKGISVECPHLRTWYIPDGWGRVMLITVIALYLLSVAGSGGTTAMFYVTSGVFEQALALQGIACMSYTMHKRGKGKGVQIFIFILGYFVLNIAAVILGIADQTFDFSHRREELKAMEEKREREMYDPTANKDL